MKQKTKIAKLKAPDFSKSAKPAAFILKQQLADFGDYSMRIYGQKTNEDRQIPDVYDGCKPVQRRILQALSDLNAKSRSSYTKAARVIGTALGKYHPHGDAACYGAAVTMANSSTPTVDGSGNWGDPLAGDDAAAYRYTECRMSRYAEHVFFDSRMLAVGQQVPNYDDKDMEYYVLPARLPEAIINGNMGIGFGITTETPSFTVPSVIAVLREALTTWKPKAATSDLEAKTVRKLLKFSYPQFGAPAYLGDADYAAGFKSLVKDGEGQVWFGPICEVDKANSTVVVDTFGPNLNLEKALDSLREKEWYVKLDDQSNMDSGDLPKFVITVKKITSFSDIQDELFDIFGTSRNYKVNLTVRQLRVDPKDKSKLAEFIEMKRFPLVKFFNTWLAQRIELEKLALTHEIEDNARDARLTEVRILASAKLDFIFKVLKSGLDFAGMAKKLAAGLKIKLDEAEYILKMQVYRLSKLDGDQERKRLVDLKAKRKTLDKLLAHPQRAVTLDLDRLEKELGL